MIKRLFLRKLLPVASAGIAIAFSAIVVVYSLSPAGTCPASGTEVKYNVHDRGYIDDHPLDARVDSESCETCHDDEFCIGCHFSDNPLEGYHHPNYVYGHTVDRFIDRAECASCHDYDGFCAPCHAAAAGRPGDHLSSAWTATEHADAGRGDIERCAGCHSDPARERVCLRCHTVVNPHGDGFGVGLGDWDDPDAACYKCHEFGDGF